jgi:hypothetical protein
MPALAIALLLAGCDKPPDTGAAGLVDTGSPDRGSDVGGDDGGGGGPGGGGGGGGGGGADSAPHDVDPDAPTILSADAWCSEHTTGTKFTAWVVEATAEDPQGDDTLLPYGSPAVVSEEGVELVRYEMVCDSTGYCIASWQEDGEPQCARAQHYLVEVTVADENLNYSAPVQIGVRVE